MQCSQHSKCCSTGQLLAVAAHFYGTAAQLARGSMRLLHSWLHCCPASPCILTLILLCSASAVTAESAVGDIHLAVATWLMHGAVKNLRATALVQAAGAAALVYSLSRTARSAVVAPGSSDGRYMLNHDKVPSSLLVTNKKSSSNCATYEQNSGNSSCMGYSTAPCIVLAAVALHSTSCAIMQALSGSRQCVPHCCEV